MKIAYISNSIIPSKAANSVHVMKMCQAFADNGHEVVLLAPDRKSQYEKKIDNVYDFYGVKKNFVIKKLWFPNIKGDFLFYTFAIFIYLFLNKKIDLVYGRFIHGCSIATFLKYQVIFESHRPMYEKNNYEFRVFKKLIKSKYLKKFIVISNALKKMYLENGYLDETKIQVEHDGADVVTDFSDKIQLLGSKDTLKIGYVGHLYKGRGIDIIIECAKQLKDMTFHIVGGLLNDVEYWKNYSKNLNNIFFYGFVSPNETKKYRNSFDIFLAPYSKKVSVVGIKDTSIYMSPIKIFEYMSHNKPIIASDLNVLKEVLNSKNSILVKSDDINGWINAIKELRDIKKREKIANYAFDNFHLYTWKNRAKKVI